MEIGILGLSRSGKTTFLELLAARSENGIAERGQSLATIFRPRDDRLELLIEREGIVKASPAEFAVFEPAGDPKNDPRTFGELQRADMLIFILRNFDNGVGTPDPKGEMDYLTQLLIEFDAKILKTKSGSLKRAISKIGDREKREKMERELVAANTLSEWLATGRPPRLHPQINEPVYQELATGVGLLSAKKAIAVLSSSDETYADAETLRKQLQEAHSIETVVQIPRWERDVRELSPEDAALFAEEFGLPTESIINKFEQTLWQSCGMIVFYTVLVEDTRVWMIPAGCSAQRAAGAIHTDIERGFIRAEIIHFADYRKAGSMHNAKPFMKVEGKDYIMQDGDIAHFRFKV